MHNYEGTLSSGTTALRRIPCAIVGARGYSGMELVRILKNHPGADLVACYATRAFNLAQELADDSLASVACLTDSEVLATSAEVVFLATPAEVSLELGPQLVARGKKVIDLSGAFRLKKHSIPEWYSFENPHAELLQAAPYGLWPFVSASAFTGSSGLIANPGCYATAAALALIPLVKSGLVDDTSLVMDAKSGATGAGRKASEALNFNEVEGDCIPYKIGKHQHHPEIVETVEAATGKRLDFHFTTHLLPIRRGLNVSVYGRLNQNGRSHANAEAALGAAFAEFYNNDPLIQFGSVAEKPQLLSLRKVVGTPRAHIAYSVHGDKVFVFSAIDNLLKGASSQAVENFNAWTGLDRTTGLTTMRGQS